MGVEQIIRNNRKDIDNFLKSFISIMKKKVESNVFFNFNFPLLVLGQDNQEQDNLTKQYTRPLMRVNLKRRGPASISKDTFFKAPHQHAPLFYKKTETGELKYIKKDNQIDILVYTKTKTEQIKIIQLIEEIIEEKQHELYCDICQIDGFDIEEKRQRNNLYLLKCTINFRTIQEINIILSVGFDSVIIEPIVEYILCDHFDLESNTCVLNDAEQSAHSSYDNCMNKAFCKQYKTIIRKERETEEEEKWKLK